MKLSEYAIRKPITAIMIALSVIVLGAISLFRLPLMYAPNVSWPSMYINASYPSSSPEEIERGITKPIEEIMGTLSGVKAIKSRSYDSRCWVRLEFGFGTDMDLMSVHVRDRLDQVRGQLPDDLERVTIRRWNTEDWAILEYRLTWLKGDQNELSALYKQTILPRLQRLQGVGSVEMHGIDERVLLVDVDQNLLNTYKMDVRSLSRTIRNNNVNTSAGYVDVGGKRVAVRSVGEFEEVSQIRDLPIREDIELHDVADVTYDFPEKRFFERLDGRDAVSVEIKKASTANLVSTAKRVTAEMNAIKAEVGDEQLRIHLVRDRSLDVTNGIKNLARSAMLGGLLAILVIFVFLRNFRSTLIIGSAIPISVLFVFMMMYFLRQFFGSSITLNLISMMGLMVAVGMLVDPAVVALENIYRKRFDEGKDALTAAIEGSKEIGMPVLAAALTTVCVFVPIIFVSDSGSSLWMKDFAVTVCISVIASLCVALTLIPLAASRGFQDRGAWLDRWLKGGLLALIVGTISLVIWSEGLSQILALIRDNLVWVVKGLGSVPPLVWGGLAVLILVPALLYYKYRKLGIKGIYARFVRGTLRYRWSTVVVACVVLGAGFHLYSKIEKRRYRWQPTRRIDVSVQVPRSYDVNDALALFAEVEGRLIPKKEELDVDAIRTRFSNRRSNRITLYLVNADEGKLSTDEVKKKVMALMPKDIPGVKFKAGRSRGGGDIGVGIEIKGRNPDILAILAEDVKLRMEGIKGVHEVETSLESGQEEIQVTVNRQKAQRYGLSTRQIATTLATALGSRGNSKFKTEEREIDIRLQLKEEDRANLEQLKNTVFESSAGDMVSFASLANFELKKGPRAIERQDRMSTVDVFANTEQKARFKVGTEMRKRMSEIAMPAGYSWQMDRRFRRIAADDKETDFTMIFAALLIYLIMASLFESYIHPFTIMFSISFAFTGVSIGLYSLNIPMDTNAFYGLLILFGIVVNNGIVLIDHINRYRAQGLSRKEAIVLGGQDRLRPIAMTAITTILGLTPLVVPMIYGTAEGYARRWGPIGLVVVSGLSVSTLMTLVLLPTIYSLMDDLANYTKRLAASVGARA
jgi:HAE1 family hydrophobic/amphiphilic exporter-1